MAVGFTPKHIVELPLDRFTQEQFLALAIDAASYAGWETGYISPSGFMAYTNRGMFSWNANITLKIEHGIATLTSESAGSEFADWGKNKKNVNGFLGHFESLKAAATPDSLQEKYNTLKERFAPEEDLLLQPPPTAKEKMSGMLSFFIPRPSYFFTPILININLLVFIIMALCGMNIFLPDNEILLQWGANFRPYTLDGQWWRLLTNCFLHIGILHLLLNMYALMYIGLLLEPYLGKIRFIAAYLLTGIAASTASLWWHETTISAGASGAIFGMYGVFLAMLTTNLIEKTARKSLMASIGVFVFYNLVYGMKGGIDNAAHIGGLLSGIVIGYIYCPGLMKPEQRRFTGVSIVAPALLIIALSAWVYRSLPNDYGQYEKQMNTFTAQEKQALEVYNINQNTSTSEALKSIKENGINNWEKNLNITHQISSMHLPKEMLARNDKLKEYAELRLASCELMYRAVRENSNQYEANFKELNTRIEAVLNELNKESQ